jgi:hypothetical protein
MKQMMEEQMMEEHADFLSKHASTSIIPPGLQPSNAASDFHSPYGMASLTPTPPPASLPHWVPHLPAT